MEFVLVLILVFLLCWFGATVYGIIAIKSIKRRLSWLEVEISRRPRAETTPVLKSAPSPVQPISAEPVRAEEPVTPSRSIEEPVDAGVAGTINLPKPVQPSILIQSARPVRTLEDQLNSLERLVGTRWLNWVGALVTLAGTAFLLKFLYDRGWIGPAGRIAIGMGIGVVLLYLGEVKLRKLHDLFSQSVSAAGCGALFLTAFLSYKFYEFSSRTATFALLCWFALFAVALAVVRRGPVLAFLGLLCAYLTPYLLSTGQDQAEALFSYLAVLALAAAVVNIMRNWPGIVSLCFIFSCIYYIGWYIKFYSPERLPIAAIGAVGLILLFGIAALARSLWRKTSVQMEECLVIASSFILGLSFLWAILSKEHRPVLGFVLCGLTLFALAALHAAWRRNGLNPVLESTLLGLASGSLLLVIPASFKADVAMLAWALAGVVFADMGARAGRILLEIAAGFCLLAGLWIGLVQGVSHTGAFIPVANSVFLAWLGVVLAWFIVGFRYFRGNPAQSQRNGVGMALQIASSFMLIALLSYEVAAWFRGEIINAGSNGPVLRDYRNAALFVLWAFYPWLWLFGARPRPRLYELSSVHYGILGFVFLLMLPGFHNRETLVFLNPVFLAALLLPAGIFLIATKMGENRNAIKASLQTFAHLLCVIVLTVELYQGLYLSSLTESSRDWVRMALISVAWAVYATVLLGIGISRNLPPWRWLALGLLGLTLLKVLFLDMAEVRQIWRVLSFMVLGALLMICSYAYSRHERMKRTATAPDKG